MRNHASPTSLALLALGASALVGACESDSAPPDSAPTGVDTLVTTAPDGSMDETVLADRETLADSVDDALAEPGAEIDAETLAETDVGDDVADAVGDTPPDDDAARQIAADRAQGLFAVVQDRDTPIADQGDRAENPQLVAAPKSRSLVAGFGHNCVVLDPSGDVYCWGFNAWANLGDRTQLHRPYPVQAQGLTGVTQVAAGAGHTCALTNGNVRCWGDYRYGQTGNCRRTEEPWPPQTVPGAVIGLPPGKTTAIAAGEGHSCALVDGGVMCWGDNIFAQLGSGGQGGYSAEATWVPGLEAQSGVTSISAGFYHTCAAISGGGVKCWGNNTFCQTGQDVTCNMGGKGVGWVVGLNLSAEVVQIAAGAFHTCVLFATGAVDCWGASANGEVGNGTWGLAPLPVPVTGMESGATAIAAGESTSCAVKNGAAWCWGSNLWGKLGVGEGAIPAGCVADATYTEMVNRCNVPVPVRGLTSGVASVVTGFDHACARMTAGGVKCWGNGGYGSIGNNRFMQYVPEATSVVWAHYPGPGGTLPLVIVPDHCP